ncbi:MAG: cold-shock protein [Candidatus Neomarinimicrobiota bacterium]|jgi:CspA family cold shock protein|nr:MAG: cold-shock protein [Candidatus Neomarinimicrobiota bacterium]|tara:strand:- start:85 stop:297 length:213 start_codon:yes stop_codon:yes gene_type:complete
MSERQKGTVKFFNEKKGYGFITKEDGNDVFVHFTSIESEDDFKTLKEGQAVEFDIESDDRGDKAVKVTAV